MTNEEIVECPSCRARIIWLWSPKDTGIGFIRCSCGETFRLPQIGAGLVVLAKERGGDADADRA